jgi:hypothetical protein
MGSKLLTQDQVKARFCDLSRKVMAEKFSYDFAADCFCGSNPMSGILDEYRFEKEIMEFIEQAVEEKLAKEVGDVLK